MLLVKYSVLTLVIYLILKYLPNQYINETDIIFISLIIVLFYLLAENVIKMFFKEDSVDPKLCNSICNSKIENMENIVSSETTKKLISQVSELQKLVESRIKERDQEDKLQMQILNAEQAQAKNAQDAQDGLDGESQEEEQENEEESSVMDNSVKEENPKDNTKNNVMNDDGRNMIMKTYPKPMKGVERSVTRQESGIISNEIDYTDYHHLPLADGYDVGSFEYGYSFLPPEKWYPEPPFPPLCVSEKRCPVLPAYTTGTPLDVKEWNEARRVTPPDNIKTSYIKEKLNSGR